MKRNYKKVALAILLIAVIGITVGYAALGTTLNINGTATAKKNTWDVSLTNIANKKGTTPSTAPAISGTTLSYAVTLTAPGDYFEYTVDVKNNGTIGAKLSAVPTVTGSSSYITHTVTYSDGTAIKAGDTLAAGATKTLKVRVEYKTSLTASTLPTADSATTYAVSLNYVQA